MSGLPNCIKNMLMKYSRVRNFIYDHPDQALREELQGVKKLLPFENSNVALITSRSWTCLENEMGEMSLSICAVYLHCQPKILSDIFQVPSILFIHFLVRHFLHYSCHHCFLYQSELNLCFFFYRWNHLFKQYRVVLFSKLSLLHQEQVEYDVFSFDFPPFQSCEQTSFLRSPPSPQLDFLNSKRARPIKR